ncbi:50S ribosomal protein L32 [Candidatus Woesebacteria bacterium RBG_16_34_12]|uniref:Large ribosomal subunit protein bL32 n=1 Tax=Candidatus Woesebacteria bacterium RBG_16_34_12 TaxID=1802480 RepID=A0A1F7X8U1_9BACT|nr:MAG: 50S ribosomal protein L32 [Candidatus Woesebacteria bacterium RBG_16_34_12]
MTPLPKKKHTKSRSGKRSGAKKGRLPTLTRCPSCKKLKPSHRACPHCGAYK